LGRDGDHRRREPGPAVPGPVVMETFVEPGWEEFPDPAPLLEPVGGPVYQVLAYDGGGTTGWCVLGIHEIAMYSPDYKILENLAFWSAGEYAGPEDRVIEQAAELAEAWDEAEVVAESFHVRHQGADLSPVRVHAVVRYVIRPRELHWQQPALAMSTITDERLRAMGLDPPLRGKPHARDAVRHALTWARRRKQDLERLKIPRLEAAPAEE
jgi:GNAT superfamily N-acetyltransferase